MEPRIEILTEKKLVGIRTRMTLSANKTVELWRSFMPRKKEISNTVGNSLYSIQFYDESLDFSSFDPNTEFEKWAAVEVAAISAVPEGMEALSLEGGLYAVFLYKGAANAFAEIFRYIFGIWLPNSIYALDNRPHFEIMGERYKGNDPASEEEVWIPVKVSK
jgi:AraC family transcriptional regulator